MSPPRRRRGVSGFLRTTVGRMPLASRMVAAAMVLVLAGLVLIGAASVMFLRGYLTARVDDQLNSLYHQTRTRILQKIDAMPNTGGSQKIIFNVQDVVPSSSESPMKVNAQYTFETRQDNGAIYSRTSSEKPNPTTYPVYPHSASALDAAAGHPFSTGSNDDAHRWRVLVQPLKLGDSNQYLIISASMDSVNATISRLITIEVIVGAAVLVLLAIVGAAVVTYSLHPLRDIERTAGAIAAGNLGLRVPERDPRTELGRLGRALNAMLGQIEAAFSAQAGSEHAARRSADAARRAADAARASAAAAHRSEEKMRRFVADASHELRTPLTTIRGFAELYRQRLDTAPGAVEHGDETRFAEANRLMRRIEAEASRMGLLVEDLLMLARLDQQRPVASEPVDLLAIAADAVQSARAIAPDRDVSLHVGAGSDGPPVVLGDEPRLRQVLRNLVDNALAHTPAGTPVQIRVRTAAGAAVVEVADQGPGLTPEQRDRVFERFYRVDKARSREAGGTGLGLAIVASLVAAHHGRVDVETAPGEGATFRVTLPLAPDDADLPPEPAELEEPDFGGGPLAVGSGTDESTGPDSAHDDEPPAPGDEPTGGPVPPSGDRAGSSTAALPADAGSTSVDAASSHVELPGGAGPTSTGPSVDPGSSTVERPADAGASTSGDAASSTGKPPADAGSPTGGTGDADGAPDAGAAPDADPSTVDDQAESRPR
ncbi:hypothetical protein NUM_45450 [Actinocatenispora comari]|uniref:histidine kinase n=1 Tax=Actinocatenispora comari TaxID=2807577 RepID=A0A8J4AD13_9ACTN|nr:hypothetical protein NUM_45450 [Actinocatenispora comari]